MLMRSALIFEDSATAVEDGNVRVLESSLEQWMCCDALGELSKRCSIHQESTEIKKIKFNFRQ